MPARHAVLATIETVANLDSVIDVRALYVEFLSFTSDCFFLSEKTQSEIYNEPEASLTSVES